MGIKERSSQYLLSSVVAAAVSLFTFPLTTRVLGPRDYGLLALGTTIAGIGAALATLGTGFVVANRWATSTRDERSAIVSTVSVLALAIATAWAALATVAFLLARDEVRFLAELPLAGLLLAMAGAILSPAWAVATEILTVEGRAGFFSVTTVAQSLATAAVTLVALFVFDRGTVSLFAGVLAGGVVGFVAGLRVVLPYLGLRFDARWRRELAQGPFLLSLLTESAQPLVERVLLSRFAGFTDLGLYIHSQRYRQLVFQGTKAVARAVWPVTLDEARDRAGAFPATQRTWNAVHVGVTCAGLAFTAIGDALISLLTNDKFTDAWVYLAPWFVLLLVQLSAKPEVATVYAFGRGATVARVALGANVVGLAATAALIPVLGTWGALLALISQAVVYRAVVRIPARRHRRVPFQDQWVAVGIALLLGAFAVKAALDPDLAGSLALLAVAEGVCLLLAAPVVGTAARALPRWRPEQG